MKKTNKTFKYSRKQRICAWLVLIGIFVCGMMAGAFMWQTKNVCTVKSGVQPELSACEMRENALVAKLNSNIDDSNRHAYELHEHNMHIYNHLYKNGCPENHNKYAKLADAERSVLAALGDVKKTLGEDKPCEIIESTLLQYVNECDEPNCHLHNAEIYSKIVEDGCSENQNKYGQMALNELQIADGVRVNDTDVNRDEIRSTVNTYKKLQMQNEAKKYLNKVEKLVNPGIEFIMELQRVIEE
jgi:hypothetical protein